MAQLPPKAPTLAQKWPSFSYRPPASASQPPRWMDDFIDFSSSRRNSHRRSNSDPIAFAETPFMNECHNSNNNELLIPCSNNNGFDRLDDEQLSSMFSDEFTTNLQSIRSSPTLSDQNSANDEPKSTMQHPMQLKNAPGEVEDGSGYEPEKESVKTHVSFSSDGGTIVDPKRVKRYNSQTE